MNLFYFCFLIKHNNTSNLRGSGEPIIYYSNVSSNPHFHCNHDIINWNTLSNVSRKKPM